MSELIDKVAKERYLRDGEVDMDDVYERVACAIGDDIDLNFTATSGGSWAMRFFTLMREGIFLPNTPTLSNAGTEEPMLSACFGLPVNDSFEGPGGIYDSLTNSARIFKLGGGVGYNFSNLRPQGDKVKSTDGVASGPISFMSLYDANVNVIKQGGRRRGAAIGILNDDHPDIKKFVVCKKEEGSLKNFNISVIVKDLNKIDEELFDMIVDGIWNNGEPGLLFYDNMNKNNPNKHLYDIHTTNPCAELPIGVDPETGGGEACNLGSINVSKCVDWGFPSWYDWKKLNDITRDATVFLDTVIDANMYPTPAITEMALRTRKIGLGIMGLHDALIMMEYAYNSHEGRMIAKDIMNSINRVAQETSKKLGIELGCYPAWKGSEWEKMGIPMRNSTLTCIAPTGTISILAGCSSGIEPYYNWVYERDNTMGGKYFICVPIFEEMINRLVNEMSPVDIKKHLYEYYNVIVFDTVDDDDFTKPTEWYIQNSDDTEYFGDIREKFIDCIKQDCFEKGTIQHMKFIPEKTRKVFVNALDISPEDHIKMQAELQAYCDNSISKTVNMPNSATKKDVANAIRLAHRLGCKGFTMYREGSRNDVVLKLKDKPKSQVGVNDEDMSHVIKDATVTINNPLVPQTNSKRVLPSTRYKVQSGCGELYIHVAEDNEKIREVFVECGGSGGCAANNNAIGRLISLGLKHNVPIAAIIRQLKKVKCDACIRNSNAEGKSCADIIGKVLEESSPVDEDITSIKYNITPPVGKTYMSTVTEDGFVCPECQSTVIFEGRCFTCPNCGFSKCG